MSRTILIVDDNESFASTVSTLLTGEGFHVVTASSGNAALRLMNGHREKPALTIVDLRMPQLDGPATIEMLRQKNKASRVIAVSGQPLVPYFSRLSHLGVRHFLPKPFRFDELLDAIRDLNAVAA